MSDSEDFDLKAEDAPPKQGGDLARKEQELFSKPPKPNSIHIRLWKDGYITFNPDNHVPVFAFLALIVITLLSLAIAIVGIWLPADAIWMDRLYTALGHAIAAIIGAMVGSAITSKKDN